MSGKQATSRSTLPKGCLAATTTSTPGETGSTSPTDGETSAPMAVPEEDTDWDETRDKLVVMEDALERDNVETALSISEEEADPFTMPASILMIRLNSLSNMPILVCGLP